jgi:DUF1680 family protein
MRMTATTTKATTGPLRLEGVTHALFRPVTHSRITGGMWAERRRVNRETSVPGFWDRLVAAGNIHDLELAAGWADGDYLNDHLPFLDTNVHKWVEALAWVLADPETDDDLAKELTGLLCRVTDLLKAAQADDGYLDSYFQVKYPGERFQQLVWGHELYCAGHLIQAAVALHRATGGTQLLDVARPMADLVVDSFGPGRIDGVCGHPEIETALVELYRETGERSYLETAGFFIDRRGHGLLKDRLFGPYYFQDRTPVRDSVAVDGHAVRQLYLLAGVADLYTETGEAPLLTAAERLWADMVGTRTYVTGGVGSHHKDESFGEAYELPNERSYCETCAAIASIQFSWRMLAITGEAKYADLIERTLYNGFLAGVSLDGQRYIYANPLQVRDGQGSRGDDGDYERRLWFDCACCPPNVMRVLGSLQHYVALESEERVLLHQYMPGEYTVAVNGGEVTFTVTTEYPWEGRVVVTMVGSTTTGAWDLALRVPQWARAWLPPSTATRSNRSSLRVGSPCTATGSRVTR